MSWPVRGFQDTSDWEEHRGHTNFSDGVPECSRSLGGNGESICEKASFFFSAVYLLPCTVQTTHLVIRILEIVGVCTRLISDRESEQVCLVSKLHFVTKGAQEVTQEITCETEHFFLPRVSCLCTDSQRKGRLVDAVQLLHQVSPYPMSCALIGFSLSPHSSARNYQVTTLFIWLDLDSLQWIGKSLGSCLWTLYK